MALEEAKYRVAKFASTDAPFIAALSYRWLEPGHPDRCRHHLQIVAKILRQFMQALAEEKGYRPADLKDFGFFWDFASLPQVSAACENSHHLVFVCQPAFELPSSIHSHVSLAHGA